MRAATLSAFRKFSAIEEAMIRASMPRTSASDPEPLPRFAASPKTVLVANRFGPNLVRPLTFRLSEVANA